MNKNEYIGRPMKECDELKAKLAAAEKRANSNKALDIITSEDACEWRDRCKAAEKRAWELERKMREVAGMALGALRMPDKEMFGRKTCLEAILGCADIALAAYAQAQAGEK